jgi:hypothetical protein
VLNYAGGDFVAALVGFGSQQFPYHSLRSDIYLNMVLRYLGLLWCQKHYGLILVNN